jgi:hypothetical protein
MSRDKILAFSVLGILAVLFLWWESDAVNALTDAIGRTLLRLFPLAIAAWVITGAFSGDRWSKERAQTPPWAKAVAIGFAATMAAWVFLFWGRAGDLILRPLFSHG